MPSKRKGKRKAAQVRLKPKSREEQIKSLHRAMAGLMDLSEAAADLHLASLASANAIAELVQSMIDIKESKPK